MVLTNVREQLLLLLLRDPTREYTIREVSLTTTINYRQVHQEIISLAKEEIILLKKRGHSTVCSLALSQKIPLYAYLESLRTASFQKKHPEVKVIINELKNLPTVYYTALLFGSRVPETARKNSDIDLLFIVPNDVNREQFEGEVSARLRLLRYPVDINVITEESFREMGKEKALNVRKEVLKNHLILYGAEFYYRLLAR